MKTRHLDRHIVLIDPKLQKGGIDKVKSFFSYFFHANCEKKIKVYVVFNLHYHSQRAKEKNQLSWASLYTTSLSTDIANTRFSIHSKKFLCILIL